MGVGSFQSNFFLLSIFLLPLPVQSHVPLQTIVGLPWKKCKFGEKSSKLGYSIRLCLCLYKLIDRPCEKRIYDLFPCSGCPCMIRSPLFSIRYRDHRKRNCDYDKRKSEYREVVQNIFVKMVMNLRGLRPT